MYESSNLVTNQPIVIGIDHGFSLIKSYHHIISKHLNGGGDQYTVIRWFENYKVDLEDLIIRFTRGV